MDVFSAFPNAVVSDQWELVEVERGTDIGDVVSNPVACDVIIDEGTYVDAHRSPDADGESSDILIYAKPEQMPTLVTAKLTNGYLWHDKLNDYYYEIREASQGKNQETGVVEHVEFLVKQTLVASYE